MKNIGIQKLVEKDVEFTVEIEEPQSAVRGHFASDEPEKDREMEQEILDRVSPRARRAWHLVKITALWNGVAASYYYFGCCSYDDEVEFTAAGEYYSSMKSEALDALNKKLSETFQSIRPLIVKTKAA